MWPQTGKWETRQPGVTVVKVAWADAIDEVLNGITGGTRSLKALYIDGIGWQASPITDGLQVDFGGVNVLNVHLGGIDMSSPGGKITSIGNIESATHIKSLLGNVQSALGYLIGRRLAVANYTPLVVGDVTPGTGLGAGASITSVVGGDAVGSVTLATGAAPASVASVTIAVKDGAYPGNAVVLACYGAHEAAVLYPALAGEVTGGNLVIGVGGTLTANHSYTFNWLRIGL